jgi:hypothetical protein
MMSNLETVRDYIGDNTEPYKYSDERIEELLEKYVYPECVATYVWQTRVSDILIQKASALKRVSIGAESHEFENMKDTTEIYREQFNFYSNLCRKKRGVTLIPT